MNLMTEPPFHFPHDEGQPPPETHQQQTEQFQVPPQPEPSFWQRYKAALLAGGLVLVLVIAGGVWAIASAGSTEAAPPPAAPTTSAPAPSNGKADNKKHAPVTKGTVTAENGDTWTVKTEKGDTVAVTIGDDTKFGTAKEPVDKAKFTVNSKVVITGKNADGKVDARRIKLSPS
jgi:hypothetical protein